MILIAEPVHFGATHVQVNSAFMALFRASYPQDQIVVIAEEEHIAAIHSNAGIKVNGIDFRTFKNYNKGGSLFWFKKIWGECRQILSVLKIARKEKPELIVWLSVFPTGHLFLQMMSKLFFRKQKQLIVLHGELEYLGQQNQKRIDKVLGALLLSAINNSGENTKYMVLGPSIKENLQKLQQLKHQDQFFIFRHPFLYHEEHYTKALHRPLRVSIFGALKKSKNAHLFFELAQRFEREIKNGQIVFQTIGKTFSDLEPYRNTLVECYEPDQFLELTQFRNKIAEQDLALFFYDPSMYQLSASGALHEAIDLRLSVLSLQNDYFVELNKAYGVKVCVNSLQEMELRIRQYLENTSSDLSIPHQTNFAFIQQNSFLLQSESLRLLLGQANILYSDIRY